MNNYVIFADTACDIKPELLAEWGVPYESLTFKFDDSDKVYKNNDMTTDEFYEKMKSGGIAKTAAANPEVFEVAFEKGMKIVLNPSPINDTLSQIDFNKLSYIVLNEVEAKHFSGSDQPQKSLEYFGKNYPALRVMLTLGKNGCIYFEDGKSIAHPIFETAVVDSTAAGDTFLGYFVAGISKNHDIPAVLKYASAAAAIAVSREGASPSIPTLCEVKDALRTMKLRPSDMASKRILFLIDDYITKNIATANLTDLSKALGYSTVYTGRIVKKLTKLRFVDYLHTKRLTLSAQLLRDTEMSVSEIIKQCGYVNESYFRKIFKDR